MISKVEREASRSQTATVALSLYTAGLSLSSDLDIITVIAIGEGESPGRACSGASQVVEDAPITGMPPDESPTTSLRPMRVIIIVNEIPYRCLPVRMTKTLFGSQETYDQGRQRGKGYQNQV